MKKNNSFVTVALSFLFILSACGEKIAVKSGEATDQDSNQLSLDNGPGQKKAFRANFLLRKTLFNNGTKSAYLFADKFSKKTWAFNDGGVISKEELSQLRSGESVAVIGQQVDNDTITIDDLSLSAEDNMMPVVEDQENTLSLNSAGSASTKSSEGEADENSFSLVRKKKKRRTLPRLPPTSGSIQMGIPDGGSPTIFVPVDFIGESAWGGVDHASLRSVIFDGPLSANSYLKLATNSKVYFGDNTDQSMDGIKGLVALDRYELVDNAKVDPYAERCNIGLIKDRALAALPKGSVPAGVARIFVLSESMAKACNFNWRATGTMNCVPNYCDSFLTTNEAASYAWAIGLNRGLRIASAIDPTDLSQTKELIGGDHSCLMGAPANTVSLNPINKAKLGLFDPGSMLDVTSSGSYTLGNYNTPGSTQVIHFVNPIKPSTKYHYYLSLRRAEGLDAGLGQEYAGKVSLHRVDFDEVSQYTDSVLVKTLSLGETYIDLDQDFSVTVESMDATSARVGLSNIESIDLTAKCAMGAMNVTTRPDDLYANLINSKPAGVVVSFELADQRFSQCGPLMYSVSLVNLPSKVTIVGNKEVILNPRGRYTFALTFKPNGAPLGAKTSWIILNNQTIPAASILVTVRK